MRCSPARVGINRIGEGGVGEVAAWRAVHVDAGPDNADHGRLERCGLRCCSFGRCRVDAVLPPRAEADFIADGHAQHLCRPLTHHQFVAGRRVSKSPTHEHLAPSHSRWVTTRNGIHESCPAPSISGGCVKHRGDEHADRRRTLDLRARADHLLHESGGHVGGEALRQDGSERVRDWHLGWASLSNQVVAAATFGVPHYRTVGPASGLEGGADDARREPCQKGQHDRGRPAPAECGTHPEGHGAHGRQAQPRQVGSPPASHRRRSARGDSSSLFT